MRKSIISIVIMFVSVFFVSCIHGSIDEQKSEVEQNMETSETEEEDDLVDNVYDAQTLCEIVKSVDYSQRIYPIDQDQFDVELEQEYKEAFYGIITNWIPMEYQDDSAVFFRDYLRGVGDLDDSGFLEALKHKSTQYSFLDYDGDGFPELAVVDLTYDGPIILKYIPEEKRVIVYNWPGEYWVLLGANQMGYYNPTSAGITRYQYRTLNVTGEVELEIDFEIYYEEDETLYKVAMIKDGNASSAMIDKEEWDEVTKGFFEAMAHPIDTVTFEEIFGKDFALQSGDPNEAVKVYEEFLVGKRGAGNVTIHTISSLRNDVGMRYVIYDISGDGVPELHIRTEEDYYLLDYRNNILFVVFKWHFNANRSSYCDILETGEIVYRNITADMENYTVYKFKFLANTIIRFSRKDSNSNGVYDEDDEYIFNDNVYVYGDQTCTMGEWLEIAGDYMYVDEDGILQVLDAVEWMIY